MILRAIFWIGLVAILMPHEPDLGFGRPGGIDATVPPEVTAWTKSAAQQGLKDPESLCHNNAQACATSLTLLDSFKAMTVHSLAQVKADIEESRHAHNTGS